MLWFLDLEFYPPKMMKRGIVSACFSKSSCLFKTVGCHSRKCCCVALLVIEYRCEFHQRPLHSNTLTIWCAIRWLRHGHIRPLHRQHLSLLQDNRWKLCERRSPGLTWILGILLEPVLSDVSVGVWLLVYLLVVSDLFFISPFELFF